MKVWVATYRGTVLTGRKNLVLLTIVTNMDETL